MIEFIWFLSFIAFLFFVEHYEKERTLKLAINEFGDPLLQMWHSKKFLEKRLFIYHKIYGTTILDEQDVYKILNLTPPIPGKDKVV